MRMLLCIFVTSFIGAALSAPFDEIETKQILPNYSLPNNLIPSNYDIEIEPFFTGPNQFTFSGAASVIFLVINSTSEIVLHYNDLIINELLTILALADNVNSRTVITGTNRDNQT